MATASTCPSSCAERPAPTPPLGRTERAARVIVGLHLLVGGLVVLGLLAAFGPARQRFCTWWCRRILRTLGVRLDLRGTPRRLTGDRGVLVVANHISWLDPVVLNAVQPARLLAKSEVSGWPVIGWLAGRARTLFIERSRLRALPRACEAVSGALRDGETVAVFPEGTTTCGRRVGRFYPAMFQAAMDADAVIQPVALRYVEPDGSISPAPAYVGGISLIRSVLSVVARPQLTIEVHLLEPLVARSFPGTGRGAGRRQRLARSVRARMKKAVLRPEVEEQCTDTMSESLVG